MCGTSFPQSYIISLRFSLQWRRLERRVSPQSERRAKSSIWKSLAKDVCGRIPKWQNLLLELAILIPPPDAEFHPYTACTLGDKTLFYIHRKVVAILCNQLQHTHWEK